MGWLIAGGQQEELALNNVDPKTLTPNELKAFRERQKKHKLAKRGLNKKAKAWADKQVPLKPSVDPNDAKTWDRAYIAALTEALTGQCYEDDKLDGIIATCPLNNPPPEGAFREKREPCNAAYWKELIKMKSGGNVGKSKDEFQFYYIRNGMDGLEKDSPFLKQKGIAPSQNQNNLSWDEGKLQLHSDVNDALVVFDKNGNLVDVYRLSVPIISYIGRKTTIGKDSYNYVYPTSTRAVVNDWDNREVRIYRSGNFDYIGLAVMDKYRLGWVDEKGVKHKYVVDIHGAGYTYGCIEVVESLNRDPATGNCVGLTETITIPNNIREYLPNYQQFLAKDAYGNPVDIKPNNSRHLGTIRVIPPK